MLHNDYRNLEDLRPLSGKCVRCSQCKFPPLTRVERRDYSSICPAYDEFKAHFNSGGGMVVMCSSLVDGRSRVTEPVRQAVYRCNACGGCDVTCKFNSDVEIQEIALALRARVFETLGPLPAHAAVLTAIRREGDPVEDADAPPGAWRSSVPHESDPKASTLLWIGPHLSRYRRHWAHLSTVFRLFEAAGMSYRVLEDEPYAGRAAVEIGDRALFEECLGRAAASIERSGAREVVCLSAEDYATLRHWLPRGPRAQVRIRHLTELYAEAVARRRLVPRHAQAARAGWHDSPYLGRLSEPFRPWQGEEKRILGQMLVTVPERPVNRGGNGCYEAPRRVLAALPGLDIREFHRRREYVYDGGETGQVRAAFPAFAAHTAERRLSEARSAGIEWMVCECPQALDHLGAVAAARPDLGVKVKSLTELLADSVFGPKERRLS